MTWCKSPIKRYYTFLSIIILNDTALHIFHPKKEFLASISNWGSCRLSGVTWYNYLEWYSTALYEIWYKKPFASSSKYHFRLWLLIQYIKMKFIIVFTFATIAMAVMGSPPPTPTFNGNVMSLEDSEMEDWEMEDWEMILMSLIYQEYLKLVESKDW